MTEQEGEKPQTKGIPGYPAPKPEDLPEEERELHLKQLEEPKTHTDEEKALIYGDIPQHNIEESLESSSGGSGVDFDLAAIGSKVYRKFAQFDTYNIEMRDGTVVRYTGLFPPEMEYEELEDIRIQIVARTNMDGKTLSPIEVRHLEKLWLDKLGEYYLFNTKTKKPMTREERLNVKEHWVINGILKSKLKRSNYDNGPIGKN